MRIWLAVLTGLLLVAGSVAIVALVRDTALTSQVRDDQRTAARAASAQQRQLSSPGPASSCMKNSPATTSRPYSPRPSSRPRRSPRHSARSCATGISAANSLSCATRRQRRRGKPSCCGTSPSCGKCHPARGAPAAADPSHSAAPNTARHAR